MIFSICDRVLTPSVNLYLIHLFRWFTHINTDTIQLRRNMPLRKTTVRKITFRPVQLYSTFLIAGNKHKQTNKSCFELNCVCIRFIICRLQDWIMHSSTCLQVLPNAVDFIWSCDKHYHKREVDFLLYILGQVVTWENNTNPLN